MREQDSHMLLQLSRGEALNGAEVRCSTQGWAGRREQESCSLRDPITHHSAEQNQVGDCH